MTVREKIAEKKRKLAAKKAVILPQQPASQKYQCKCIECKMPYETEKELDLDGQGRCPSCQTERNIFYSKIETQAKSAPSREFAPSFDTLPGITHQGIKFVHLKSFK